MSRHQAQLALRGLRILRDGRALTTVPWTAIGIVEPLALLPRQADDAEPRLPHTIRLPRPLVARRLQIRASRRQLATDKSLEFRVETCPAWAVAEARWMLGFLTASTLAATFLMFRLPFDAFAHAPAAYNVLRADVPALEAWLRSYGVDTLTLLVFALLLFSLPLLLLFAHRSARLLLQAAKRHRHYTIDQQALTIRTESGEEATYPWIDICAVESRVGAWIRLRNPLGYDVTWLPLAPLPDRTKQAQFVLLLSLLARGHEDRRAADDHRRERRQVACILLLAYAAYLVTTAVVLHFQGRLAPDNLYLLGLPLTLFLLAPLINLRRRASRRSGAAKR